MSDSSYFIVWDRTTGRILKRGYMAKAYVPMQAEGNRWAFTTELVRGGQYVSDVDIGLVSNRPDMPVVVSKTEVLANGYDEVVISNVPVGAAYTLTNEGIGIDGETVDDGELVLHFEDAGEYVARLVLFPYNDFLVTIHAT